MDKIALQILEKLREALPGAQVYWEKEPAFGLHGAAVTAELKQRKFTLQFESQAGQGRPDELDPSLAEQVVDDFVNFFENSMYRREKFTRLI